VTAPPLQTRDPAHPARRHVDASVHLAVAAVDGRTRLATLAERGGYRARLTDPAECQIHIVNPTGGLVGGDALEIEAHVGPAATLLLTTPAAERVYRSAGPTANVRCRLQAQSGARLEWLPQPTVVYDGARFARRLELDLARDASALLVETLALGRQAHGERLSDVRVSDQWRVRIAGRLAFAEALRLDGAASAAFDRAALGAGAGATATLVYVAPDAAARLEAARAMLGTAVPCGASVVDGVLVARWLGADPGALAAELQRFLADFRGRALPRGW
jgi:urease accessory protein